MTTETETPAADDQDPLRFLVTSALFYLGIVAIVALSVGHYRFALGTLAGGAISLINLFWLKRHLGQLLGRTDSRMTGLTAQVNLVIRLTVTALLLYLLIVPAHVSIFGLVTGLAALFVAVLAYIVVTITRRGK